MIDIQIRPEAFSYDVQSLVQAFYPGEDFQINREVSEAYRTLKVFYETDKITIALYDREQKLFEECSDCDCTAVFDSAHATDAGRKATKNILKKLLYGLLTKDTGMTLPWGNLTGIRPAKIPGALMEEGLTEEEVCRTMKETYLISDEKLALAMEISKRERTLLADIPYRQGYSLYVGIPFCPTTCLYCSFTSYPIGMYAAKTDAYVDAVIREIQFLGQKLKGRVLNTVYIGGGTPTTLSAAQLERLIQALKQHFNFSTVREFTVEAGRPDSITRDKLEVLKQQNVSRISINPQTMHQKTLNLIGRRHTVAQVRDAFAMARDCGMDNINMDFILGLPEENEEMVRQTMEETMGLAPEGITIHSLAVKRASRLNIEKESYDHLHMENNQRLMEITQEYARQMGMAPYYLYRQKNMSGNQENVGYAKPGCEGLYNILMMGDFQDVWAVGAGAVTKLLPGSGYPGYREDLFAGKRRSAVRVDTVKNVDQYIERIEEMIARKAAIFVSIQPCT